MFGSIYLFAGTDSVQVPAYFNFPKAYNNWEYKFLAGISLTKLPTNIVEEEINTSPVAFADFRLGLPLNTDFNIYFASNYISTIGTLGLQYSILNGSVSASIGAKGSMWFGHLDIESIKLKSYGFIIKPQVNLGIDFGDFLLTTSFDVQFNQMYTYAEDSLIAKFNMPKSGYTLKFTIEQPFYHKQWLLLGVGLNYATFYYQSWLSYSAIKQYLLYPEISIGFIL